MIEKSLTWTEKSWVWSA